LIALAAIVGEWWAIGKAAGAARGVEVDNFNYVIR
jgi:hypothetical protein